MCTDLTSFVSVYILLHYMFWNFSRANDIEVGFKVNQSSAYVICTPKTLAGSEWTGRVPGYLAKELSEEPPSGIRPSLEKVDLESVHQKFIWLGQSNSCFFNHLPALLLPSPSNVLRLISLFSWLFSSISQPRVTSISGCSTCKYLHGSVSPGP